MARRKAHPLIKEIKSAMMLGQFIPYGDMSEFVQDLESIEKKLEVMAGRDGNHVAVELYETFLAACYEKVEETDDSGGYFGMFFQDLFVG
jgi:microcystin degradation protein MlrC